MSLYEDSTDYSGEKKCVYNYLLAQESPAVLEEFLKFEDLVIGGYANAFPDKIAYHWDDVQKLKRARGL